MFNYYNPSKIIFETGILKNKNKLREVIGDYKNDHKTQKNLNEEDENDEYAELYRTGRGSAA